MDQSLKVSVDSEYVETRTGNKNGKDWSISTQSCWAHFVDPAGVAEKFPTKIQLTLDAGQKPYKTGQYFLNPSSFFRGDFDRLSLRPALHPLPAKSV